MSAAIHNSYPAFPQDNDATGSPGMSLRDYFAEGAMRAFVGTSKCVCLDGLGGAEDVTARAAYKLADAMLKARNA